MAIIIDREMGANLEQKLLLLGEVARKIQQQRNPKRVWTKAETMARDDADYNIIIHLAMVELSPLREGLPPCYGREYGLHATCLICRYDERCIYRVCTACRHHLPLNRDREG